jgi:hypothetical protein
MRAGGSADGVFGVFLLVVLLVAALASIVALARERHTPNRTSRSRSPPWC